MNSDKDPHHLQTRATTMLLKPIDDLGQWIDKSQREIEHDIREKDKSNPNVWPLSIQNMKLINRLYSLMTIAFEKLDSMSPLQFFRYLRTLTAL